MTARRVARLIATVAVLGALTSAGPALAAGSASGPGRAPGQPSPVQVPPAPQPAALVVTPAAAEQSPAQEEKAETEAEPPTLESRIPPVSGRSYRLGKKIELSVGLGLSLNDAFWEKFIPELSAGYHINDDFYVGLRGGYAIDIGAGHVNACTGAPPSGTCGAPTDSQLKKLPGNVTGTVVAQFAWTPLYGKVNLFGEKVIHLDTSALVEAGVAILGPQPDPNASSVSPEFAPGIGERFFLSPSMAISMELREMLYSSSGLQSQMLFNLGFVILL